MADAAKIGRLSSFVWSIAELLRGDFKQSEYGRIVMPFVVLRRLDGVLAGTKEAVLEIAASLPEDTDDEAKGVMLGAAAGHGPSLWNTSRFTFETLRGQEAGDIHRNLVAYITAFSPAVRDVFLDKFQFPEQLKRLQAAGLLWRVFERFCVLIGVE